MKILLIGATGVLGRSFCKLAPQKEDLEITAMVRTPEKAEVLEPYGVQVIQGSILNPDSISHALVGKDVVLNFASAIPRKLKPAHHDWDMNDRIRTQGTLNLLEQANDVFYCQAGVVFLYGDHHGEWIQEDSPVFPGRFARTSYEMEQMFLNAKNNISGVSFRFSLIYHATAWHTQAMLKELSKRRFPIVGDGRYYWNMIHAEDAAEAVWTILANKNQIHDREIVVVSDDVPVTCSEFLSYLCHLLGVDEPTRIPNKIAKLALGNEIVETLTASFRCKTDKMKSFGWKPAFPSFREGFQSLLQTS
jgi:nucleoside-diphosphate-sugar epimerase